MTKAVCLALVAAAIAAIGFAALLLPPRGLEKTAEFDEFHRMFFRIDRSGDASAKYVVTLPKSELSDFLKLLIGRMGTDQARRIFSELVRASFAHYGMELRGLDCELGGLGAGENLSIKLTWETPSIARWENGRWEISLYWSNGLEAAKDVIASLEHGWMQIRALGQFHRIDVAFYNQRSTIAFVLPEGSSEVSSPSFGSTWSLDLGGGNSFEASLRLEQTDEGWTVVERGFLSTTSKERISITPERLLENYPFYSITYAGIPPKTSRSRNRSTRFAWT